MSLRTYVSSILILLSSQHPKYYWHLCPSRNILWALLSSVIFFQVKHVACLVVYRAAIVGYCTCRAFFAETGVDDARGGPTRCIVKWSAVALVIVRMRNKHEEKTTRVNSLKNYRQAYENSNIYQKSRTLSGELCKQNLKCIMYSN